MSVLVMSMVFKRYPVGGNEMTLALALADHCNDDGENIFPTVAAMAEKTRQSVRSVQRILGKMLADGWLILEGKRDASHAAPNQYRINPAWLNGVEYAVLAPEKRGDNLAPQYKRGMTDEAERGDTAVTTITISKPSYGVTNVTPARSKPEAPPDNPVGVGFNAELGMFNNIPESVMDAWDTAYPEITVDDEIAKAEQWYIANPRKRKSNHMRFLVNWLARANSTALDRRARKPFAKQVPQVRH